MSMEVHAPLLHLKSEGWGDCAVVETALGDAVRVSADERSRRRHMFSVTTDGIVRGFHIDDGELTHSTNVGFEGERVCSIALEYSGSSGGSLYTGSEHGRLRKFSLSSCTLETTFKLSGNNFRPGKVSHIKVAGLESLCSAAMEHQMNGDEVCSSVIRIWDRNTGRCLRALTGHSAEVKTTCMTSGSTMISGDADGYIRIWDFRRRHAEVHRFSWTSDSIADMSSNEGMLYVAVAGHRDSLTTSPQLPGLPPKGPTRNLGRTRGRTMREIITESMNRSVLGSSCAQKPLDRSSSLASLQNTFVHSMPSSSSGLRRSRALMRVIDLRSHLVLRELNQLDIWKSPLEHISCSRLAMDAGKGQRLLLLSGQPAGAASSRDCVYGISTDTAECLVEFVPQTGRNSSPSHGTSISAHEDYVCAGYDDSTMVLWNLRDQFKKGFEGKRSLSLLERQIWTCRLKEENEVRREPWAAKLARIQSELLHLASQLKSRARFMDRETYATWTEGIFRLKELGKAARDEFRAMRLQSVWPHQQDVERVIGCCMASGNIEGALRTIKEAHAAGLTILPKMGVQIMLGLPFDGSLGQQRFGAAEANLATCQGTEARTFANRTIKLMKRCGVFPGPEIHTAVVGLYSRTDDVGGALKALKRAKRLCIKIRAPGYRMLLSALLRARNRRATIETIMQEMIDRSIEPGVHDYEVVIRACLRDSAWDGADKWLAHLSNANLPLEKVLYLTRVVAEALAEHGATATKSRDSGGEAMAQTMLERLRNMVSKCDACTDILLQLLMAMDQGTEALDLIRKLAMDGDERVRQTYPPTIDTINYCVTYVAKKNAATPSEAFAFVDLMRLRFQVEPDAETHAALMDACIDADRVDLAIAHFQKLKSSAVKLSVQVYNALLAAFESQKDSVSTSETLTIMAQQDVPPDVQTYRVLLCSAARRGNGARALMLLDEVRNSGMEIPVDVRALAIVALVASHDISAIESCVVDEMHGSHFCMRCLLQAMLGLKTVDPESAAARGAQHFLRSTVDWSRHPPRLPAVMARLQVQPWESLVSQLIETLVASQAREMQQLTAKVYNFMLHRGIPIPVAVHGYVINSLLKGNRENEAKQMVSILLQAGTRQVDENAATMSETSGTNIDLRALMDTERNADRTDVLTQVVIGMSAGGDPVSALKTLFAALDQGFKMRDANGWRAILRAASKQHDPRLSRVVLQLMDKSQFMPGESMWVEIIHAASSHIDGPAAMRMLTVIKQRRVTITGKMCSAILEACVAGNDHDGTRRMLVHMTNRTMKIDAAVFKRMILRAVETKSEDGLDQAFDMLSVMQQSGGRADMDVYAAMLQAAAATRDAHSAKKLMKIIDDTKSLRLNEACAIPYVKALALGRQLKEAFRYATEKLEPLASNLGIELFEALMEGAAYANDLTFAETMLREMKLRGVRPNPLCKKSLCLLYARFHKPVKACAQIADESTGRVLWPGAQVAAALLGTIARLLDSSMPDVEIIKLLSTVVELLRAARGSRRVVRLWQRAQSSFSMIRRKFKSRHWSPSQQVQELQKELIEEVENVKMAAFLPDGRVPTNT